MIPPTSILKFIFPHTSTGSPFDLNSLLGIFSASGCGSMWSRHLHEITLSSMSILISADVSMSPVLTIVALGPILQLFNLTVVSGQIFLFAVLLGHPCSELWVFLSLFL